MTNDVILNEEAVKRIAYEASDEDWLTEKEAEILAFIEQRCQAGSRVDIDLLTPEQKAELNKLITDHLRVVMRTGCSGYLGRETAERSRAECVRDPAYAAWLRENERWIGEEEPDDDREDEDDEDQ